MHNSHARTTSSRSRSSRGHDLKPRRPRSPPPPARTPAAAAQKASSGHAPWAPHEFPKPPPIVAPVDLLSPKPLLCTPPDRRPTGRRDPSLLDRPPARPGLRFALARASTAGWVLAAEAAPHAASPAPLRDLPQRLPDFPARPPGHPSAASRTSQCGRLASPSCRSSTSFPDNTMIVASAAVSALELCTSVSLPKCLTTKKNCCCAEC
jgi:hypothetical protein